MPRAVERFVAEWCTDPPGPLPEVSQQEALDRALGAVQFINHARDEDISLGAAIENALDLLLLAWSYLEVSPSDNRAAESA